MSGERQVNVKFQSELDFGGRETCYPFSVSDIVFDILLFLTYFGVLADLKTVPWKNDSSVLNITGRTCTFVGENDDSYNFNCWEHSPILASLTLLFIYMPSLNVFATLFGPGTAGRVGEVWGLVMVILCWIEYFVVHFSAGSWFFAFLGGTMLYLGFMMVDRRIRYLKDQNRNTKSLKERIKSSLLTLLKFLPWTLLPPSLAIYSFHFHNHKNHGIG